MADAAQIQVVGARELRRKLRRAGDQMEDLKDLHRDVGEVVAGTARTLAPRRSGKLIGTIRAARQKSGAVVRAGKLAVPYAGPVHFGWHTRPNEAKGWRGGPIAPQPFLYDAADKRRSDVIRLYEQRIAEITRKV